MLDLQVRHFISAAKSPSTLRAYQTDWKHFVNWCGEANLGPLPATPETVATYIAALAATHRPATISRRLASIAKVHEIARCASPINNIVTETMKGIRRTLGTAQNGKTPLFTEDVRRIIQHLPDDLSGTRDRALILMGFAGGFRRSELAALMVEDTVLTVEGLVVTVHRSKTDQEGEGRKLALPRGFYTETCPIRAFHNWLDRSGIYQGPLFRGINRHGQLLAGKLHQDSIGLILKRAAKAAGFDPALYAGHSLRAGLATQAYLNGASELAIMKQTGHKSLGTLRRYIRDGTLFRDNPADKLGL